MIPSIIFKTHYFNPQTPITVFMTPHNPKHLLQYFEVDFLLLNFPQDTQCIIKVVLFSLNGNNSG